MRRAMAHGLNRFDAPAHVSELNVQMAHALLRGVSAKDVATLSGVSTRTAYRWRRDIVAMESVKVDGWAAVFVRRRYRPPLRISAWERDT